MIAYIEHTHTPAGTIERPKYLGNKLAVIDGLVA